MADASLIGSECCTKCFQNPGIHETTWFPPRTVGVSNYIQLDAIINPWLVQKRLLPCSRLSCVSDFWDELAIFGATFNSDITAYWIIATYLTEHPPTASLSHLVLSHFRDLLPPPRDSHLCFVNTLDQILVKTLPEAQRTQAIESKT